MNLIGLPGTDGKEVAVNMVRSASAALQSIRNKRPATMASDNGAITLWIDDDGKYRVAFHRYWCALDERQLSSLVKVRRWLREWMPKMEREAAEMSLGVYIRTGEVWVESFEPRFSLTSELAEALSFPSLEAAQEAHSRAAESLPISMIMEAVAADTLGPCIVPLCKLEALIEIEQTPLRGAVEVFAMLKKSSKYYHQFQGWRKPARREDGPGATMIFEHLTGGNA